MRKRISLMCLFLLMVPFLVLAQSNIKGVVTEKSTGEPMPGVTVVVKGQTGGTITDIDGKYSLSANVGDVLIFSFIGMSSQEVEVTGSEVNIKLVSDMVALDEVVAIGYGSVKKSDLTGSVASVRSAEIEKSTPTTVSQALQGRVAGVQVLSNDGAPGSGVTIRIRGASTLTAGSHPLYVIDGLQILPTNDPDFNPLADINPSDIESLEILKDASSTAIYGAEGSNGVILITTKQGKSGSSKINVSLQMGVSELPREVEMLTPEQYAYNMQDRNNSRFGADPTYKNPWDKRIEEEIWNTDGTKWTDLTMRTAKKLGANVGFSGGNNGTTYSASVGMNDEQGIVLNSGYKRLTSRVNLNQKINETTKMGVNLSYSKSMYEGMINDWTQANVLVQSLTLNPYVPVDDALGETLDENEEGIGFWNMQNPYTYIKDVDFQKNFDRTIGKFYIEKKLIKGLTFYTSIGGNIEYREVSKFWPSTTQQGKNVSARAVVDEERITNWISESRLNYNKRFNEHSLGVTAVFEAKAKEHKKLNNEVSGFGNESLGIYDLKTSTTVNSPIHTNVESSMVSGLGRVNYSYKDKYLVTGSLRYDASSKFGEKNKGGLFPSLGLAWRANQEVFLESADWISNLKVRLSYGKTGNNQIPEYNSMSALGSGKYNYGQAVVVGMNTIRMKNDDLKWEETYSYNGGIDFGVFNERISLSADVYYKKTVDMLFTEPLPPTSGYESALKNKGEMENKGFELALNTVNLDGEFKWTTNFTFSMNRGEITDLAGTDEILFSRGMARISNEISVRPGQSLGAYYGYIQDGVYNNEAEVNNGVPDNIGSKALGEVKFVDVNGDGVINSSDKVRLANTLPKHTGGFGNTFAYKGFDLYTFMRWSYGNDVVNGNVTFATMTRTSNNILRDLDGDSWSATHPERNYHQYMGQSHENAFRSEYVEDGSFLRMDNLVLGYTLPSALAKKARLHKLRVYGSVSNVFVISRYSWYDPEVNTGWGSAAQLGPGADIGSYPKPRTFMVGLELTL